MTISLFPSLHMLARPNLSPQALVVVRSSPATRIDAMGRVDDCLADTLRHDYDPASGAYLGWLVEEGRTNLVLHGRDQSRSPWSRSGLTAARTTTGRDGAAGTASTLTATQAPGMVFQAVTVASAAYTLSVDLHRLGGSGQVALTLDGGASWFDVTAQVGSAWARVSITQTLANPTVGLRLATSGDVVAADYWQLEAGSFATSRIVTTTAPVTRAADTLTVPTNTGNWFNGDEGTLYMEASVFSASTGPKCLFGSPNEPDGIDCSVNVPVNGVHTNIGTIASGFYGAAPSQQAVTISQPFRFAFGWGLKGGAAVHDGVLFQGYSAGSRWDTPRLSFGHQSRLGPQRWLNGHLRHVAVFPRRLPNTEIVELTTL